MPLPVASLALSGVVLGLGAAFAPLGAASYECSETQRERLGLGGYTVDATVRTCTATAATATADGPQQVVSRSRLRLVSNRVVAENEFFTVELVAALQRPDGGVAERRCDITPRIRAGRWRTLDAQCDAVAPAAAGSYRASGYAEWTGPFGFRGTVPVSPDGAPARTLLISGAGTPSDAATGAAGSPPAGPSAAASETASVASTASQLPRPLPGGTGAGPAPVAVPPGEGQAAPLRPWLLGSALAAALTAGAHRWLVAAHRRRLGDGTG